MKNIYICTHTLIYPDSSNNTWGSTAERRCKDPVLIVRNSTNSYGAVPICSNSRLFSLAKPQKWVSSLLKRFLHKTAAGVKSSSWLIMWDQHSCCDSRGSLTNGKQWGMELQPTPHLFYAAANGALHTHLRDTVKFSKNTPSHKCTFLEMLLQNHFERSHFVLSTNQKHCRHSDPSHCWMLCNYTARQPMTHNTYLGQIMQEKGKKWSCLHSPAEEEEWQPHRLEGGCMVEANTHSRIGRQTLISCALRGLALHADWDCAVAAGHKAISAATAEWSLLLTPLQLQNQMELYYYRMIWVGRNLKNHPVPTSLLWVQGHLPLDHIS